jgi:hypothetical protein
MKNIFKLLGFGIVALAIVVAGLSVQDGLKSFRTGDRVVTVKGLAEREVEADLAVWMLTHTATGNDLQIVQLAMDANKKKIDSFLQSAGFSIGEISISPLVSQDLMAQAYRPQGAEMGRYILTQTVMVRSEDISKIDRVVGKVDELLRSGVTLVDTQSPRYVYRGLNSIKPEMLAEAIANARSGADEFAKASGQSVGDIKSANQGVFQILPRDEGLPIPESSQRSKLVRVVSTVNFYLE